MSASATCPQCGRPLPQDALSGVCPDCLLGLLASETQAAPTLLSPTAAEIQPPPHSALRTPHSAFASPRPFGDYELLEEIAHGGMGIVYRARQKSLNRIVAVKMILAGQFAGKQIIQRFRGEVAAAAMLQHPNIVAVHEVGVHDGQHFFSMDYVEGQNLAQLVGNRPLPRAKAARYVKLIAEAIHYAHGQGILHRDLKPSNVLIDAATDQPRITDFGLAKRLDSESSLTVTGQVLGSPNFMPPEQAGAHRGKVGRYSDVYGLGGILYFLLTARAPFQGATLETTIHEVLNTEPLSPRALNPSVPRDLETICLKCLEKEPSRRYPTAQDLADELGRFLSDEPILARPASQFEKVWRWCRRKPALAGSLAVAAMLLLIVAIGSPIAALRIARERANAEQRLYDSLVSEARAKRQARQSGYRDEVFALLQRANALDVPKKDLSALRQEASQCLGDFVGLTPITFDDFPTNAAIKLTRLDPAGRLAAIVLDDSTILLRLLPAGEIVARWKSEPGLRSLSFNPDGEQLISVHHPESSSRNLNQRPAADRVCVWTRDGTGRWPEAAEVSVLPGAFASLSSATRQFIAVDNLSAQVVELRDSKTRSLVQSVEYSTGMNVDQIAVSGDQRFVALAWGFGRDRQVMEVRDWATGKIIGNAEEKWGWHRSLAFSRDGKYVAWLTPRGGRIYATEGWRLEHEIREYFEPPSQIAFAADGTVAGWPLIHLNGIRLKDWTRNEDVAVLREPRRAHEVFFATGGSSLLTAGGRQALLYNLDMSHEKLSLHGHVDGVSGVAFSPDGSRLASVGRDEILRVWELSTSRLAWTGEMSSAGESVEFSPDGQLLATGNSGRGPVLLWDARTGQRLKEVEIHGSATWTVRFSPDGRYFGSANHGDGVKVWALSQSRAAESTEANVDLTLVKSFPGVVFGLVFSPDSSQLVFMRRSTENPNDDKEVYLWGVKGEGAPQPLATNLSTYKRSQAFTRDGRYLLNTDTDRAVVAFDVATGKEAHRFQLEALSPSQLAEARRPRGWGGVASLCLNPDGTALATQSLSGTSVDVRDAKTGRLLYSLPEQNGAVWDLAWSPDGRRLAVSRSNGDITIWNLSEIERVLAGLKLPP
ncbi:MAG: protein kinase [Verrucomicrobia bacterium]|nr:protein kinase [Verrucomicrobiota bacterium]